MQDAFSERQRGSGKMCEEGRHALFIDTLSSILQLHFLLYVYLLPSITKPPAQHMCSLQGSELAHANNFTSDYY